MQEDTLTDLEKINIRRFCWYPVRGQDGSQSTWLYFSKYNQLEYRISNLSNYEIKIIREFLGKLIILESGPFEAAQNLDTDKVAVWTHNKNELFDRKYLYNQQRFELVNFLGISPGPGYYNTAIRLFV
jgi:hypothetical protein